jgi:L-threonylcarbamoyladenylate synthase
MSLFSRPSPTRAEHVLADLHGRVDIVLDAGPTSVGVESTIVDLSSNVPTLLRPGAIDVEALRPYLPNITVADVRRSENGPMPAPGMLDKHYAPRTPVVVHAGDRTTALRAMKRDIEQRAERGERVLALAYVEDLGALRDLPVELMELGSERAPATVAGRLYSALRESDDANGTVIVARYVTTPHALTNAINDRLRRAASG